MKTRLESGPLKADLISTVVHSYKLLTNDVNIVHSLTLNDFILSNLFNRAKNNETILFHLAICILNILFVPYRVYLLQNLGKPIVLKGNWKFESLFH